MSLNRVMLIGRVGKDPEIKSFDGQNGQRKCAQFTLATGEKYKDRNGETKENTDWHNIVVWDKPAEFCEKYVKKGDNIFIEGKIRTRSWEKDGEKKYVTEILAHAVQNLTPKSDSQRNTPPPPPQNDWRNQATTPVSAGEPQDDDLPF